MPSRGGVASAKADVIVLSSSSSEEEGRIREEGAVEAFSPALVRSTTNKPSEKSITKKKKKDDAMVGKEDKKKAKKMENNGSSSSSSSPTTLGAAGGSASCSFPMTRVWRLVRGEGGNTAAADVRTTHDAVFLINKASACSNGKPYLDVAKRKKKSGQAHAYCGYLKKPQPFPSLWGWLIGFTDQASTVCNGKQYEFLSDFIPEKVKAEDALKVRALVEM